MDVSFLLAPTAHNTSAPYNLLILTPQYLSLLFLFLLVTLHFHGWLHDDITCLYQLTFPLLQGYRGLPQRSVKLGKWKTLKYGNRNIETEVRK